MEDVKQQLQQQQGPQAAAAAVVKAHQDWASGLGLLEQRLRLATQLREVSALRCQDFMDLLDSQRQARHQHLKQDPAYWSCPNPCPSDEDSDCSSTPRSSSAANLAFPAELYYSSSLHNTVRRRSRRRRSSGGSAR